MTPKYNQNTLKNIPGVNVHIQCTSTVQQFCSRDDMLDIMAGSRNDFQRNRSKILTLFIEDRELFADIHIYNSVSLIKSQMSNNLSQ